MILVIFFTQSYSKTAIILLAKKPSRAFDALKIIQNSAFLTQTEFNQSFDNILSISTLTGFLDFIRSSEKINLIQ